eukprot:CAMPEP_0206150682 /NCGR_PEP_ID=MMETSP1473-20131121/38425_1 /ASSEMBLY_ACC=CAM_ASM_001109 /TAXON_ID=1461547 /ORGANISM="Stichococcus sp, Strain RCC1054" /LENGTH=123 /DNA_ID=CAMNT_0053548193 /DNA_START=316 /DNA_END=687 /DNA_ORIENTATION=+
MARSVKVEEHAKPAPIAREVSAVGTQLPSISPAPWYLSGRNPLKQQRVYLPCNFRKRVCTRCSGMGHKAEDCVEQPVRTSVQLNGMHLAAPGLTVPMERTPNGIPAGPRHWHDNGEAALQHTQ